MPIDSDQLNTSYLGTTDFPVPVPSTVFKIFKKFSILKNSFLALSNLPSKKVALIFHLFFILLLLLQFSTSPLLLIIHLVRGFTLPPSPDLTASGECTAAAGQHQEITLHSATAGMLLVVVDRTGQAVGHVVLL